MRAGMPDLIRMDDERQTTAHARIAWTWPTLSSQPCPLNSNSLLMSAQMGSGLPH